MDTREGLKDFDVGDYAFDAEESEGDVWVFSRVHDPARMKAEFAARKARVLG